MSLLLEPRSFLLQSAHVAQAARAREAAVPDPLGGWSRFLDWQ